MTLDEFKFIYWMEYAHRMWGRVLGVVFAAPAVYFAAQGALSGALKRRLGLLFLLGGGQGLVGWWMVKSGLEVCCYSAGGGSQQCPHPLHVFISNTGTR